MKVLFLTPSIRPLGARRSLVELIQGLPPHILPHVLCSGTGGIHDELQKMGIPVSVAPMGAWRKAKGRITSLLRQIPKGKATFRSFQPDLIHANEFHILPQAHRIQTSPVPVVGHVRLGITPRQITNYELSQCSRIVCVSEAVRSLFEGAPDVHEKTRVVHNGVKLDRFLGKVDPLPEVTEWLGSFEDRPTLFGLFGLISERKNQLMAVEALEQAVSKGSNLALLLAGDAFKSSEEYGEKLKEKINSTEELKKRVLWLPFRDDIERLYASIDCNLLVSSEEGFGRTIIEAGTCRKPSIGSNVGGIPEIIDNNKTGFLLEDLRAETLAKRMNTYQEMTDEQREVMGQAAKQRTLGKFSLDAYVTKMIAVWQETLNEKN